MYALRYFNVESILLAEFLQQRHVPRLPLAETEVVSHQHSSGAQARYQHVLYKRFRSLLRKRLVEGKHEDLLDPFRLHVFQTLLRRVQQFRGAFGCNNPGRVRIESEHRRLPSALAAEIDDAPENAAMSGMHAVEITDADNAVTRFRADFAEP